MTVPLALVVEDDDEWREIFGECLEALGFQVDKAPRLALALKLLRSSRVQYSLVLIDASLDQVAESLAEAEILLEDLALGTRTPRVIVVSGYWQRQELADRLSPYRNVVSEVADKTMLVSKAAISLLLQEASEVSRSQPSAELERDYLSYLASPRDVTGQSFQNLVERWLNVCSPYWVVDRNRRVPTGEIDLIARCDDGSSPLAKYSDYLLVECKDRADVIGVSPVDHLSGMMQRAKVEVGALVSINGLSGRLAGADARGVREFFFRDGLVILDIRGADLLEVLAGRDSFEELVLRQLHALHFT